MFEEIKARWGGVVDKLRGGYAPDEGFDEEEDEVDEGVISAPRRSGSATASTTSTKEYGIREYGTTREHGAARDYGAPRDYGGSRSPEVRKSAPLSEVRRDDSRPMAPVAGRVEPLVTARPSIHIAQPRTTKEVSKMCEKLQKGEFVCLNLESMERAEAQRFLDIVSGVALALNCVQEETGHWTYIVAPPGVKITSEIHKTVTEEVDRWKIKFAH